MTTTVLTHVEVDQLNALLAVPDPQPDGPWEYVIGNTQRYVSKGPLESIGHLNDLLASLRDQHFIVFSKMNLEGVWCQAAREGDRFHTECNVPVPPDNHIHRYRGDDGQDLQLALAQAVLGAYVLTGGNLFAEWAGPEPTVDQW